MFPKEIDKMGNLLKKIVIVGIILAIPIIFNYNCISKWNANDSNCNTIFKDV